jgi:hypothetical protein
LAKEKEEETGEEEGGGGEGAGREGAPHIKSNDPEPAGGQKGFLGQWPYSVKIKKDCFQGKNCIKKKLDLRK